MSTVLLVVSARTSDPVDERRGPRRDYHALARELDAAVVDRDDIERDPVARVIRRLLGTGPALAWRAFASRRGVDAIVTDGEHIGIPLALLLKLARDGTVHVTIGHRLTTLRKWPFFTLLRVDTHLSRIALHSRRQRELAVSRLRIEPRRLAVVPYQVDTSFWSPREARAERIVLSAGIEHRDYPTLFAAAAGLDARVVVGAASHWSRQRNTAAGARLPSNVTVASFDYEALRDMYARAAVVAVPLADVDFQAGVTTILEAMAMGKPVVVTHAEGQFDVVVDRRSVTRGAVPRPRPIGLIAVLARGAGYPLEPNGIYVAPYDSVALRRALAYLLDHPQERARLGAAGRRAAERFFTLERFAQRMRALVDAASAERVETRRAALVRLEGGRRAGE